MASFSIFPDWRLILERGQQAEKGIEELDMDRISQKTKNFRKRSLSAEPEDEGSKAPESDGEQEERRMALEEIKFLQRQREKKSGIPALPSLSTQTGFTGGLSKKPAESNHKGAVNHRNEGGGGDGDKDDLVLQDTFAQETAVMVEDPNMLKYIEKELAKQRGRTIEGDNQVLKDLKSAEDELYKIPEHLKVKGRGSGEGSTQWTTGIAEIQLPIEYKLRNIEETEAAKKLLQEKRLTGRAKSDIIIPSSYSADYFQRGRDYAEKLRRDHPELYKERRSQEEGSGIRPADSSKDGAGQRQAASDEFMMERFRKRERHRVMRR